MAGAEGQHGTGRPLRYQHNRDQQPPPSQPDSRITALVLPSRSSMRFVGVRVRWNQIRQTVEGCRPGPERVRRASCAVEAGQRAQVLPAGPAPTTRRPATAPVDVGIHPFDHVHGVGLRPFGQRRADLGQPLFPVRQVGPGGRAGVGQLRAVARAAPPPLPGSPAGAARADSRRAPRPDGPPPCCPGRGWCRRSAPPPGRTGQHEAQRVRGMTGRRPDLDLHSGGGQDRSLGDPFGAVAVRRVQGVHRRRR